MLLKDWLKENNFNSWEEAIESGELHLERTEMDMKEWFLESYTLREVILILEGVVRTSYGNWEYIEDKKLWVYIY